MNEEASRGIAPEFGNDGFRLGSLLSMEEIDQIARIAHFGQVDKLGVDYIEHPRAVARLVASAVPSYAECSPDSQNVIQSAALLHDVIEDTPLDTSDLRSLLVSNLVIVVVEILTRKKGIPNEVYYANIAGNSQARIVKVADMMHNCDPLRMALLDDETCSRLKKKYAKGIDLITVRFPKDRSAFLI